MLFTAFFCLTVFTRRVCVWVCRYSMHRSVRICIFKCRQAMSFWFDVDFVLFFFSYPFLDKNALGSLFSSATPHSPLHRFISASWKKKPSAHAAVTLDFICAADGDIYCSLSLYVIEKSSNKNHIFSLPFGLLLSYLFRKAINSKCTMNARRPRSLRSFFFFFSLGIE